MAYIINKFSGEQLVVLEDGTIDTSTSLGLVGRNYVGYGEIQNENFVYLLENFANEFPPSKPLTGQIWFNTGDNSANVYNGDFWNPIGTATVSATAPDNPNAGVLWVDTAANQLKIWLGDQWRFIGPESVPGFGSTRARATLLDDSVGDPRPVVFLETDNKVIAICTSEAFTINPSTAVSGFSNNLISGINLSSTARINGSITGNSGSSDKLSTPRSINGVSFDGTQNITVKSSTTNKLKAGPNIIGNDFDGSSELTWSIDSTPSNSIGKIVSRNSEGGFSAGTITATFVGTLNGNVDITTGTSKFNIVEANTFVGASLTGNAFSATQLANARKINGVSFNGTNDITVTAAAGTLTGNQLNSTVTQSSLTVVGTLVNLSVADAGIQVGSSGSLSMLVDSSVPTIRSTVGKLNLDLGPSGPDLSFVDSATSLTLGGPNAPAIIGDNLTNIGVNGYKFNGVYANNFYGNASTATTAVTATNLAGGGAGAIPYQTFSGTTAMLGLGSPGQVLTAQSGSIIWSTINREPLRRGNFLTLINTTTTGSINSYDGSLDATIAVDATSNNVASKVVSRDSSGNFSAGTISANLTGNVSGNVTGNLNGLTTSGTSAPGANQILRSDVSGYVNFGYINSAISNNENPTISQIITTNGADNYFRKSSISHLTTAVRSNASGTWGINISGSAASASTAGSAVNATNAVYATSAGSATNATNATYATSAGSATNATNATNAVYATSAGSATTATNSSQLGGVSLGSAGTSQGVTRTILLASVSLTPSPNQTYSDYEIAVDLSAWESQYSYRNIHLTWVKTSGYVTAYTADANANNVYWGWVDFADKWHYTRWSGPNRIKLNFQWRTTNVISNNSVWTMYVWYQL